MSLLPNPTPQGKAGLPDYTYGQSFLCLTLSAATMETVAKQMQIVFPYVYDSALNYDDSGSFADFVNGVADKETQLSTETITTAGRRSFKHYGGLLLAAWFLTHALQLPRKLSREPAPQPFSFPFPS